MTIFQPVEYIHNSDECENLFVLSRFKISTTTSVIYLNQTHILEWYVGKDGSKNGHCKDRCLKGVG